MRFVLVFRIILLILWCKKELENKGLKYYRRVMKG